MITIFTATYNRKYTLPRLYDSLKKQTNINFEWIVVNDGSTDDTKSYLKEIKDDNERKFNFYYISKENGGKHRAINDGIKIAKGELFVIVDSDDFMSKEAVAVINENWQKYKREDLLGICFRIGNPKTGKMIGKPFKKSPSYATLQKLNYLWNIYCDKAEIFRTDILKKYPFPVFKNEKFCTEIVWFFSLTNKMKKRVNGGGNMICLNNIIYYSEYLPDGLSAKYKKICEGNPKGYICSLKLQLKIPYFYLHPRMVAGAIKNLIKMFIKSKL